MTQNTANTAKTTETITTTSLNTILSDPADLEVFQRAMDTWRTKTKDTIGALKTMATIGTALNLLYSKGAEKQINRERLTAIVKGAFPGLDRRERSDYRALSNTFIEVKCFVEFSQIKSLNPTYLLNAWKKAVKEDQENLAIAKAEWRMAQIKAAGGTDLNGEILANKEEVITCKAGTGTEEGAEVLAEGIEEGNYSNPLDAALAAISDKEEVLFSDTASPLKTGYDTIVRPNPLTGKEIIENVYHATNQAIIYFNEGRLNAHDLAALEQQLTRTLRHINSVDMSEGATIEENEERKVA